jgi:mono/diheme cytochrome c family protein
MMKRAIGLTILAMVALLAGPATVQAQVNPVLIGEGAQVWANNCGRCHNIRPPTERTDAQWTIILMHMRARANLTRHQAEAVLAYLQATNTAEAPTTATAPVEKPRTGGRSGGRVPAS